MVCSSLWRNVLADSWLGLYEQQDPNQQDCNLRGKFQTDDDGEYAFYCVRPTPYPVPDDGPAGKLLKLMDRHPYRPAHIHLVVSARRLPPRSAHKCNQVMLDGFKPITTQLFDAESQYLEDDSVFAVKDSLIVKFVERKDDPQAEMELKYDILMVPSTEVGELDPPLRSSGIGAGY